MRGVIKNNWFKSFLKDRMPARSPIPFPTLSSGTNVLLLLTKHLQKIVSTFKDLCNLIWPTWISKDILPQLKVLKLNHTRKVPFAT